MASYQPVTTLPNGEPAPGTEWRVFISRKGYKRISKQLPSYDAAEKWALPIEAAMKGNTPVNFHELSKTTVGDVLRWFRDEVADERKTWRWDTNLINRLVRQPWTHLTLDRMNEVAAALRAYINERTTGDQAVKGQTVHRELNTISTAFTKAVKRAGLTTINPVKLIERPAKVPAKSAKVWSAEDLKRFLDLMEFDAAKAPDVESATAFIPWTLLILNTTGLRPISLFATALDWIDEEGQCIHYPAGCVKNGEAYDCPLDAMALPLVLQLAAYMRAKKQRKLFPVTYGSVAEMFKRYREELAMEYPHVAGLIIYGQRHTWTTCNVPLFDSLVEMLAYTGRKTVRSLLPYFQPEAKTQAEKLNERRRLAAAGMRQAPDRTEYKDLKVS